MAKNQADLPEITSHWQKRHLSFDALHETLTPTKVSISVRTPVVNDDSSTSFKVERKQVVCVSEFDKFKVSDFSVQSLSLSGNLGNLSTMTVHSNNPDVSIDNIDRLASILDSQESVSDVESTN